MHTLFITGCATGFGRALAETALAEGHRVIATDPDLDAARAAIQGAPERGLALALDVRDPAQVLAARDAALAWHAPDVLVNNGGYALFGTIEESPVDDVEAMFAVNVFGLIRITQALLPTLRAQRGVVVQLSSVAGRMVFTESGFYAATKYALEAMSEALFQECAPDGLRLRLIQPGSFDTQFSRRAGEVSPPRLASSPYAARRPGWDARKNAVLEPPQPAALVVRAILDTLDDPRPFLRQPVGPDSARMVGLRDTLGIDAFTRLMGDRAGWQGPHQPGDALSPTEALSLLGPSGAAPSPAVYQALAPTLAAYQHGLLEHWAEIPRGPAALKRLAELN